MTRTSSTYTVFTPNGFNSGVLRRDSANTVINVSNSTLDSPARWGVRLSTRLPGKVSGNTFRGGGAGDFIIYGVQVADGSTNVLISGKYVPKL